MYESVRAVSWPKWLGARTVVALRVVKVRTVLLRVPTLWHELQVELVVSSGVRRCRKMLRRRRETSRPRRLGRGASSLSRSKCRMQVSVPTECK